MITVRSLSKYFGDTRAVDDLSFSINRGEIYGIVGPDGAGKSTLLRMLSGILVPDRGSIEIDGAALHDNLYAVKENIAYMPQRFGLYEDLTVEENIFFFGRLFGLSRREIIARIPALYEFSRLGPFSDRLAGKLSGGMKQKLGLACSLVHSPGLILLDEPTNGVDPVSRREFWKILYSLLGGGVTIVVSTAYLDEVERCNRIAMMSGGRFLKEGRPLEIKASMGGVVLEVITDNVWMAEKFITEEGYENVIREGNSVKIFTTDSAVDLAAIKKIMAKKNITITSALKKMQTLENCFMEIVTKNG